MGNKVILVSIDGMRPDGLMNGKNPYVNELLNTSAYTLEGETVMPSMTFPCHMSMFLGTSPETHGMKRHLYIEDDNRPNGIVEQLFEADKDCAMYYTWERLRYMAKPETLKESYFLHVYAFEHTDAIVTDRALDFIGKAKPDFVFIHMVETDEKGGHQTGWMSETYLDYVNHAIGNVKRIIEEAGDEYTVIITADHGGHDDTHGTEAPEDMTIPMIFHGKQFERGKKLSGVSILDIAPTVADIIGVPKVREWEGKSLLED